MDEIIKVVDRSILGDLLYKTNINYLSIDFFKRCKKPRKIIVAEEDEKLKIFKISLEQYNVFQTYVYPYYLNEKKLKLSE
jgi:predicted nicotinamide N-methyase